MGPKERQTVEQNSLSKKRRRNNGESHRRKEKEGMGKFEQFRPRPSS
ncbi:uncharacterized protein G2W53_022905 [Senna tora]|uniref:Uncharacterized protein n=1 Tax=Senna tora TaxID=362788 RepID=A0A834TPU3_9FABA|nr:uncharacterized protein G2W53_022905 [Senna tora]